MVVAGIYSTILLGSKLSLIATDQSAAVVFLLTMFLVTVMVFTQGLSRQRRTLQAGVILGVLAVYAMVFLRVNIAERTHLIEYSVVAVLVFEALTERYKNRRSRVAVAVTAIAVSSLIGIVDECIQLAVPDRVFDGRDIFFNLSASSMAVIAVTVLRWARGKVYSRN